MNKKIDQDQIATLEKERNAALERVLKRVKERKETGEANASHTSHSSSGARTHSSYVSA